MINLEIAMTVAIVFVAAVNILWFFMFIFSCFSKKKRRKEQFDVEKSIIKFSKRIVITIFALLIIYVVVVLVLFVQTQSEPTVLTENLFGFFKAEGGFLAIIKIAGEVTERAIEYKKEHSKKTTQRKDD